MKCASSGEKNDLLQSNIMQSAPTQEKFSFGRSSRYVPGFGIIVAGCSTLLWLLLYATHQSPGFFAVDNLFSFAVFCHYLDVVL